MDNYHTVNSTGLEEHRDQQEDDIEDHQSQTAGNDENTDTSNLGLAQLQVSKFRKRRTLPEGDETVRKLEVAFRRLNWSSNNRSFLKRFLTKQVLELLKHRVTLESGATLLDIIKAGVEHLEAPLGVFAADSESYSTFRPLLHPIVCSLNSSGPEVTQPDQEGLSFGIVTNMMDFHTEVLSKAKADGLIEYVCVNIYRGIKKYPFQPKMTLDQYVTMEKELRLAFKAMAGVTLPVSADEAPDLAKGGGTYYPLNKLPQSLERQLDREGLLFDRGDPLVMAANGYNHWPSGRGIYLFASSEDQVASNSTKDGKNVSYVWVNESEHLKVVVGRRDCDLGKAYDRAFEIAEQLGDIVAMSRDQSGQFGFLTMSPALVGTGLKITARMHLPFLGTEAIFREEICSQHSLECNRVHRPWSSSFRRRDDGNIFEVTNRRTFGLKEADVLLDVYQGLVEIIKIEQRYQSGL